MSATTDNTEDSTEDNTETNDNRYKRNPAKRVFAIEFNDATHEVSDGDSERSPNYAVLPTGERANRVYMCGTLMETEDVGNDSEYWRGRFVDNSDPDGGVQDCYIYAGEYQSEAMNFLKSVEPPVYISVVGKPNRYETDDGDVYVSISPELIKEVDVQERNTWVVDTASQTLRRLDNFAAQRDDENVDEDVAIALEEYGYDVLKYKQGVVEALEYLRDEQ